MANQFGERIRQLRVSQKLLLRQIAAKLEVDSSIISKIERGERPIKKEQILLLAKILNTDTDGLLTLWVADQIMEVTINEDVALRAMEVAGNSLKKLRNKKQK